MGLQPLRTDKGNSISFGLQGKRGLASVILLQYKKGANGEKNEG